MEKIKQNMIKQIKNYYLGETKEDRMFLLQGYLGAIILTLLCAGGILTP